MRGFPVFLGKEFTEIVRTWRAWVLPLILIGVGLASPMVASLTPALVESVAGGQPGVVIEVPEPTTVDAYLQFLKNCVQIVLIAVIIATAGAVSSEKRSGTAVLVLTKPLSRDAMIAAKAVSNWVLLAIATLAGWLACVAGTALLFDTQDLGRFAAATAVWVVLASMFVAVMLLLSVALPSQAGAAGIGLVVYVVLFGLAGWGPARDHTPAGLLTYGDRLLLGEDPALMWPLAGAALVALVCLGAAVWIFRRQEL